MISAPLGSIDEVFREVEAKSAHYGVVPIENSSEGMINNTLDSFRHSSLVISGEVEMRIHQNLLVKNGYRFISSRADLLPLPILSPVPFVAG